MTLVGSETPVRDCFGELVDGRQVHRYTLGGHNGLRLGVLDYGAAVQQLWAPDATGAYANVVLGSADQGFPGELTVRVTYSVEDRDVRIEFEAMTAAPTAVNLTQHAHFNLAGESSDSMGGARGRHPSAKPSPVEVGRSSHAPPVPCEI